MNRLSTAFFIIAFPDTRYIIFRIQNPDIPRAGRGGAAHGGVAGRSGARHFGTPTDWFAQETNNHPAVQSIEDTCPERLLGSTNKAKPM